MDTKTQARIIFAAVEKYGESHQMIKAVEEMGELQQAIARIIEWAMEGKETPWLELVANLIEEIADVNIMINQLAYIAGAEAVGEAIDKKLRRLAGRMGLEIDEAAP